MFEQIIDALKTILGALFSLNVFMGALAGLIMTKMFESFASPEKLFSRRSRALVGSNRDGRLWHKKSWYVYHRTYHDDGEILRKEIWKIQYKLFNHQVKTYDKNNKMSYVEH